MKNSSSLHRLNADRGLRSWRKLAYLAANALRNITPGRRMPFVRYAPDASYDEWMALETEASTGRKWSNLFWSRLPWARLAHQLGPLHVLDIGCGRGGYGPRFVQWAGSALVSYRGMDPSPKNGDIWHSVSQQEPRCSFTCAGAVDIASVLDDRVNLIISQSALEHIDGDLQLMRDIDAWAVGQNRPVTQIHVIPSASALPLYLFHGIRQYPLRSVSALARACSRWDAHAYALGGRASWSLHWRTITWPHLLRHGSDRRLESWYPEASWEAFKRDVTSGRGSPLFWALTLSYNPTPDRT